MIEFFNPSDVPAPGAFSRATRAAGLVFVSGTGAGNDIGGQAREGTAAEQTRWALENVAAILDSGLAGQWSHPKVLAAERRMIRTALDLGIAPRVEISNPGQAKPYLDLGVRHFCMGWDVEILFDWFKREGEAMRKILEGG